jgi:predicted metal-dependent enzyme (double-stranded beta helix superfamily)
MSYSFDQFCADCRAALKADAGPGGHDKVRQNLEKLLKDADFLAAQCGPNAQPGIRTIYKDDETGYNVLVHIYEKGKSGPPHDHGKSWAVYGQAEGWTDMTIWKRLDDGKDDSKAELTKENTFRLEPGMAGKFEVGQIHSIHFPDGAQFVRVTGTDLDAIPTKRFDPEKQTAAVGSRL